jgi:hypothetical protein
MLYCPRIFDGLPMRIIKYSSVIPTTLRFISRKLEGFGLLELVFTTELLPSKTVRILCGFGLVTTASMSDWSVVVKRDGQNNATCKARSETYRKDG